MTALTHRPQSASAGPVLGYAALVLPAGIALVAYATAMARGSGVLGDPDVYLHVAAGRWILAHQAVPTGDPFSHTVFGRPWIAHEWLAEVLSAWLYDHAGWSGLVTATALSFAAALAILVGALRRYVDAPTAVIGGVAAWGLCFPHLLARPHVVALPLLAWWIARLVAARAADRAPPFALALVMIPWANLHGSALFGLALAALLAGEAVFEAEDWRTAAARAARWSAFGVVALLAALVTPHGLAGLAQPFELLRASAILARIGEWASPDFQQLQPLELWLMVALLASWALGLHLPITRIAMLLVLLHMALSHQRHAEILGVAAPLLVAPALAPQLRQHAAIAAMQDHARAVFAGLSPTLVRVAGLALALGIAAVATTLRHPAPEPSARYTPATAVAAARAAGLSGPVLNDYDFGGYLVFAGIAPFVDGRADMYGDAFIRREGELAALPALLAEYRIAWTLVRVNTPRAVLLDHLPGWRRLYADAVAVVHVREAASALNGAAGAPPPSDPHPPATSRAARP